MWSEWGGRGPIVVWSCGSLSIYDREGISIPMVIIPRRSSYMSGILLLGALGREHCLALAVTASQNRCWRIRKVHRVCVDV